MAKQGTKDIVIYRGDYEEWPMQMQNNIGTVAEPILEDMDLTGHAFSAQIREAVDGPLLVEFDFDNTLASGIIIPYLTAVKTSALQIGSWVWDMQSVYDQRVRTWVKGKVTVVGDVTKEETP